MYQIDEKSMETLIGKAKSMQRAIGEWVDEVERASMQHVSEEASVYNPDAYSEHHAWQENASSDVFQMKD